MNRVGQSYDAPDLGTADPMNAYTTAKITMGIAARPSAGSIPAPATFAAGAMIEKIETPIAEPTPIATMSTIVKPCLRRISEDMGERLARASRPRQHALREQARNQIDQHPGQSADDRAVDADELQVTA